MPSSRIDRLPLLAKRSYRTVRVLGQVINWRFEFKPEDAWVGLFWRRADFDYLPNQQWWDAWICVVPCFPLHLHWALPA